MARKSRYDIPKPTWTCPHCGFVHSAADLMRLDSERFQCKRCGKPFPTGQADERPLIRLLSGESRPPPASAPCHAS